MPNDPSPDQELITFWMPRSLLTAVDHAAKVQFSNRSDFIRRALMKDLSPEEQKRVLEEMKTDRTPRTPAAPDRERVEWRPATGAEEFERFPVYEQANIAALWSAMELMDRSRSALAGAKEVAAANKQRTGFSIPNLNRLYKAWRLADRDWRTLINRRRYSELWKSQTITAERPPAPAARESAGRGPRKEKRARLPARRLTDVAWVSVGLYECAAGGPLSPAHRIGERRVERPSRSYPAEALFALRLNGDSMEGAGLLSGDVVLCVWAERREAEAGDIVVAHLLGDGCTLKRLHGPEGGRWLEPESTNPVHERIALDGEGEPQAVIQAVMLRRLEPEV